MKSLGSRFLIPFGLLAVLIAMFVFHQAYEASRRHAEDLASRQATVAVEFNLAIRDYVAERIRPVMEELGGRDMFLPETMSTSFVSRSIFERVRTKFPDLVIRFSSENPRNPVNTANPDELRMIDYFRRNPRVGQRTEEIQIDGKRYLAHFTPKWMKQECLRCHDDPKDAPAELVKRYGATASFHRKVGDVAGLDTVAVPMEAISAGLAAEMRSQLMILALGLALLFGAIFLIFRLVVTRRLVAMAGHFNEIAAHAQSPSMMPVEVKGNDEISIVGAAFNKLVEQLRTTHSSLELRVRLRTEELQNVNERLHSELADRKQAELALAEESVRRRILFEQSRDGIVVLDENGKVFEANPRYAEMLGYTMEEVLDLHVWDWDTQWTREELEGKIQRVDASGDHIETRHRRKDGTVFDVEISTNGAVTAGRKHIFCVCRDVSERKAAENALRESEERYRLLFNSGNDAVFVHLSLPGGVPGRFIEANDIACKRLGYSREELLEMSPLDIDASDAQPDVSWIMEQLAAQGRAVWEGAHVAKDGRRIPVEISNHRFDLDGSPVILATVRDISERKRAEEALREFQQQLLDIINFLPDATLVIDKEGKVIAWNRAMEDMTGIAAEEMLGKGDYEYSLPFYGERTPILIDLVLEAHEEVEAKYEKINRKGSVLLCEEHLPSLREKEVYLSITACALRDSRGNVVGAIESIRDITDRRRALEEKEKLEAQLRHAHKMEAVGTLAGGIAHDFNNILGAIIGNAEMALMDLRQLDPTKYYLEQMLKAGLRAKDLVKQVLTFSRMRQEQERAPVAIAPIIREGLEFLRASLPSTIEIRQNIESSTGAALADATEIHQVLVNLCTNAAQAMEDGGGRLEVGLSEVVVASDTAGIPEDLVHGSYLRLTVSDTGHGMSPEILDRIFDPYFTTKEVGKGSGLGLAVVHGIVKRHHGALLVRSKPWEGANFTIYLPKIESEATAPVERKAPIPRGTGRILFVDDEKALADLGRQMLGRLGYEVVAKTSSVEALELFKARPEDFDLIITDYTMPRMTGADLARQMMCIRADIPVILCTGFTEMITEAMARKMGIRAFLLKPLRLGDMAEAVKNALERIQQ